MPETMKGKQTKFPIRYMIALLGHCGILVAYAMRVNLSVGLVAMVNSTYVQETSHQKMDPECKRSGGNTTGSSKNGEFQWDEKIQGTILGSFFYGYIFTQLPGGLLATNFGGKWVFGIGILITSILTIITPFAARQSVYLFIAVRVIEGIGEGVTFPATHAMLGKWAPIYERSKLATLIYSGSSLGTLIAYPISGVLCDSDFLDGWPLVFYTFGLIGVVWFLLWAWLASSTPEKHQWISSSELSYILKNRGGGQSQKPVPTPWKSILTSLPVWSIVIAHTCNNWTFYTFLTCLPLYFKEVLNFPIQENGLLSALPYLVSFIVALLAGQVADFLRYRGMLSTGNVRKLMTGTGLFIPAGLLVLTSYMGCSQVVAAVALVTTAIGFIGFSSAGYSVNHLDLSPAYAGILLGITNSFATVPGFLGPTVVGILTEDKPTRGQWQIVFFISAGIAVFGAIVFILLGKGHEQNWSKKSPYFGDDSSRDEVNRPLVQE